MSKFSVGDNIRFRATGIVAKIIHIGQCDWSTTGEHDPNKTYYFFELNPDDDPFAEYFDEPGRTVGLEEVETADRAPDDDPHGFDKI